MQPLNPDFEKPALVVTHGSGWIRLGFANDKHAFLEVPALTGRVWGKPKDWHSHCAGNDVIKKGPMLDRVHPIERGRVVDWDEAQFLWERALIREWATWRPIHQPMVFAELPSYTPADRERAAQIMMEEHSVLNLYLAQDSALAMLGSGRLTGLAVSIGHGVTSAVPVYEGHALTHFAASSPLGGADIAEYLNQLLEPRGYNFPPANRESLHNAINYTTYVAYDAEKELPQNIAKYYLQMQGNPCVTTERYQCVEVLFRPSLIGTPDTGAAQAVQNVIHDALKKCTDAELHAAMLDNIILWGGVANLPGMGARVHKELRAVLPPEDERLRVISVPDAHELAFLGGALVATEPSFAAKCITRSDWEEEGYRAVRRRCF